MLLKQFILIIFTAALNSSAISDVVDQDWQTAGDANVMYDTDTNNLWLDLSVTANISHDTVVENLESGGLFEGWRLATQDEVLELWSHANITVDERVWVTYQYQQVNDMVTRLGPTTMFELGMFNIATHAIGMVEGGPSLIPSERWAMEITYAPDGVYSRTSANFYTWDVTVPSHHNSTYLVKTITNYADGDLAPWNNPDGIINMADLIIANQIILGLRTATTLQYSHGDLNEDGIINTGDLIKIYSLYYE